MKKSNSIAEIAKALAKFQAAVENPKYDRKNPQYGSQYATLGNVINTIRKPLAENGLSFLQESFVTEDGLHVGVTTLLMHESGEFIEFTPLVLPAFKMAKGGGKTYDAQAAGIGITYGRRYSLTSALGISSEEDDDANGIKQDPQPQGTQQPKGELKKYPPKDQPQGNSGQAPKKLSDKQLKMVQDLMKDVTPLFMAEGETDDQGREKLKKSLAAKVGDFGGFAKNMTAAQASKAITILQDAKGGK